MSVTVRIPTALRRFSNERAEVPLDISSPTTIATVLDALARECPGVVDRVLDERGRVRRHVNVFIGTEDARALGGLDAPVAAGAEVTILPAVSGGSDDLRSRRRRRLVGRGRGATRGRVLLALAPEEHHTCDRSTDRCELRQRSSFTH